MSGPNTIKTIRSIPQERTAMPEQPAEERVKNFFEVALGYGVEHALREADRCLDCSDPRCLKGCPVSVDIPSFLRKLSSKDFRGAYDVLARTNVLPAICGRVCPQEDQCEGMCSVGDSLEPVAIGRLERWLGDRAIELGWSSDTLPQPNGFKVGIVGSGPAGIACAADLARLGCAVTIFEALHAPGGVLRYGIPEFRLPNQVIDAEISKLTRLGVTIECNTLVGRLFTLEQMLDEQGFHALFVATGAGLPKFMGIEGEGLNGVLSANELLTRCNLMQAGHFPEFDTPLGLGRRVAVIGSGNTAMDALRVSRRVGAQAVLCVYRRSRTECPARAEELHHAEQEGVEFHWLTNPIAILGDSDGRVRALRCQRMQLGEPDASGRRKPEPVAGSEFDLDVDTVVYAIGTQANPIIGQTSKIARNRWGYIEADASLATSLAGVYAGGDIVTGSATVILAMGAGRRAARAIAGHLGISSPERGAQGPYLFNLPPDSRRYVRMRARTPAADRDLKSQRLIPAALRPFVPLGQARHPFPLVLLDEPAAGSDTLCSLSKLMDAAFAAVRAAQPDGAELDRVALRLEQSMRELCADAGGDLAELGLRARARLVEGAPANEREPLMALCGALIDALPNGAAVGCTRAGAEQALEHMRAHQERTRLSAVLAELAQLDAALARTERNDFMTTPAAWSGEALGLALGPQASSSFDLAALSALLSPLRATTAEAPRAARTEALRAALARSNVLTLPPSAWVFHSCAAAARALDERLQDLEALLRAVEQAHLETRGRVNTATGALHQLADNDGARGLLPASLILLDADALTAEEQTQLSELLTTDLPIKVLCTSKSLAPATLPITLLAHTALPGGRAALLAAAARSNPDVYLVQAAISELARCAPVLMQALCTPRPALIALYTGADDQTLPAYLAAAAGCAARIFPTLVRPAGGQLQIDLNPQPESLWPTATFSGEDPALQRTQVEEPFCAAHVLACWPALSHELELKPEPAWHAEQWPVGALLAQQTQATEAAEPYVNVVDPEDNWLRAIVSGHVLAYTQHVAESWRALQAAALPISAQQTAEQAPTEEPASAVIPKPAAAAEPTPATPPEAAAPEQAGQAYVETGRCSSCDECVKRAPGLFVYNADKRAILRDKRSGSYRELVEAAEHCKMAIIHPGEPWDEAEPDLAELRQRAALFA